MSDTQPEPRADDRATVDALIRSELYFCVQKVFETLYPTETFQPSAYLEAMCKAAEDAVAEDGARLLVNMPPRYMKSTVISIALPAFCLGHNPGLQFMVATYSSEFATLHSNQFRTVVESEWFRRIFPRFKIDPRNNRADEVRTTMGGGRKAVAVGGSVTGRGADVLIIDDLMKAADARSETARRTAETFYEETLVSRLNNKRKASIIAVQQRLSEDDTSAYLLSKGFRHLNMPAIAFKDREELPLYRGRIFVRLTGDPLCPEREDLPALAKVRTEMGDAAFSAQYLQEPVPDGGNIFDFDLIHKVRNPPDRALCAPVIQSWDPAYTIGPNSAFSVCTTWGLYEEKWYLLHVLREQLTFPDLLRKIVAHQARWQADEVVIEGAGSGIQLVQQLRRDGGHRNIHICKLGVGNKEARLIEQSARLSSGQFVVATAAIWYGDLRQEFRGFPIGRYADQVDSVSQFVAWVNSRRGSYITGTMPPVHRRQESEIRRR